ncbi:hypothetical protein KR054_002430, partial [Drosophila jambulina]
SGRELQQSEQLAWKTIRNHRYLITNSHEVSRNLDALVERLRVEDMAEFGNALKKLSAKVLEQAGCHDQHTQSLQWSLLDFLLSLTDEPIQNIRRNWVLMNQHRRSVIAALEAAERRSNGSKDAAASVDPEVDWVALLREDFLQPAHSLGGSSDSLSEWSDEESDPAESGALERDTRTDEQATHPAIPTNPSASVHLPPGEVDRPKSSNFRIQPELFTLRKGQGSGLQLNKMPQLAPPLPPMAASPYEESVRDEQKLSGGIHASWWLQNVRSFALPADADHLENFAVSYVQFLNLKTVGLLELRPPNTATEACLLREILFMFVRPASCGFFNFDKEARRIQVRGNISVHTVTAVKALKSQVMNHLSLSISLFQDTLKGFLEANVLPAVQDMLELRHIVDEHTLFSHEASTGTLECFAYGLRDLVQPISQLLVEYEDRESEASLIDFVAEFRQHFRRLHLLRSLAQDAILGEGPQHLRSMYLLSRLYSQTQPHVPHQKLATALLLVSLKRYCSIIDAWWRRATLEDRQNEFVVERCEPGDSSGYVRKRSVPPDEGPRVRECFKELRHCPFYQILLEHALESGDTQDLLANVNKLGEMLANSNESQPRSLYDELAAQLFTQVRIYCGGKRPPEETTEKVQEEEKEVDEEKAVRMAEELLLSSVQSIRNLDLLHILTRPARERLLESQERHRSAASSVQVREVLSQLEDSTCLQLKAELPDALREILLRRQSLANEYAIRAYLEDLHLGESIGFLRHTMLLEAYYLLFPFYNTLFVRIETQSGWARESQLSSELYEVLLPVYPQCAGQLHVQVISQVACRSHNAYEALEALELVYDMPAALQRILTERHMQSYNAVWRLMLKIKWAVWKLESLAFLRRPKAEPYAPMDLHDLTIRRLEILRFWLIYLIDCLHSHLMGALAVKFERRISGCKNIRELSAQHDDYVARLLTRCLLAEDFAPFRVALEQLFYLVFVLHMEWTACARHLGDADALSLAMDHDDDSSGGTRDEYLAHNQVAEIETTYIRCHQTLGDILHKLVYQQDHGFLTALEVAVNTSVPY